MVFVDTCPLVIQPMCVSLPALQFFASFGTTGSSLSLPLLAIVPLMWVSKLRQLRLLAKVRYPPRPVPSRPIALAAAPNRPLSLSTSAQIALYLVLPSLSRMDFVLPILPATWQVCARCGGPSMAIVSIVSPVLHRGVLLWQTIAKESVKWPADSDADSAGAAPEVAASQSVTSEEQDGDGDGEEDEEVGQEQQEDEDEQEDDREEEDD